MPMDIKIYQAAGWAETDGSQFLQAARQWYNEYELKPVVGSGLSTSLTDYKTPQQDGLLTRPDAQPLISFLVKSGFEYLEAQGYKIVGLPLKVNRIWLNEMESGHSHPTHDHYGQVLSGTLYVDMPPGAPGICFDTLRKGLFQAPLEIREHTIFNSDAWEAIPQEGQILMWPSYVPHYVNAAEFEGVRRSIAFDLAM